MGFDPVEEYAARKQALRQAEARRVAAVKAQGMAPIECGPEVVLIAPARGPVVGMVPVRMVPVGGDGYEPVARGHKGRSALVEFDVFAKMMSQSKRGPDDDPLFSQVQVDVARDYRALTEFVNGAGVKCSSITDAGGAGGGCDFMDVFAANAAQLRSYHRAIGDGVGKDVRRVRPSVAAGKIRVSNATLAKGKRKLILNRTLVDQVCLGGMDLSAVLVAHGWAVGGKNRKTLLAALVAVLDRMALVWVAGKQSS